MTPADLAAKSGAVEAVRRKWWAKVAPRVEAAVADAHAHATKAITDSLKATEDGRPTARKARRSPSFAAALARLDELWGWLAGPSAASLDGVLRDAREAAYRAAFRMHRGMVPEALWVSADPEPTVSGVRLVRGALIHGYDLRRELEGPFADAKRRLSAVVVAAGRRDASQAIGRDVLGAWREQTLRAIRAAALRALTDGVEYADTEAGRDLIHPDYLAA